MNVLIYSLIGLWVAIRYSRGDLDSPWGELAILFVGVFWPVYVLSMSIFWIVTVLSYSIMWLGRR